MGVNDRIIGTDITAQELLHDIRKWRKIFIKSSQLRFCLDLHRSVRADSDIGLNDHGIASLCGKRLPRFIIRNDMLARCRDPCLDKGILHLGFFDVFLDPVYAGTGRDIEIRPQPGIRPKPVFVHGFQPVDPSVLMDEKSDRTVNLVIVFQ